MKKEDKKARPRGGASHPCPTCGGHTSVVVTKRVEKDGGGPTVQRNRECNSCGRRYVTYERAEK